MRTLVLFLLCLHAYNLQHFELPPGCTIKACATNCPLPTVESACKSLTKAHIARKAFNHLPWIGMIHYTQDYT